MLDLSLIFCMLLIVVAFLYASVGHGGASGYLALMLLFNFSPDFMRPAALILNIFISLIAFYQYYRTVKFNWKLFAALTCTSIPAAYIGGTISIDSGVYKKILAAILVFSIIRILVRSKDTQIKSDIRYLPVLLIGAGIGLISGLIGIGGGIILSPLLLLLNWATIKESAALSALFITVNSIAGLAGNYKAGLLIVDEQMAMLTLLAVFGGFMGAYYGASHFSTNLLRFFLALVLAIASFKLYFA